MNQDYTDVTILLDRSGSMASIKEDAEGGINTFIEDQKKITGKCVLTLFQFDSQSFDTSIDAKPIGEVDPISMVPRSMTPLLDSMAKAIGITGDRLKAMDEAVRPGKVIFIVATDGLENASREMTREKISAMVKTQTETYKWEFVYIGANQDAFAEGAGMGFDPRTTMTYAANAIGTRCAYQSLSNNVAQMRTGMKDVMDFEDSDYKKQKEAGV